MEPDGYVIIEPKINSKDFDKELKKLEEQINAYKEKLNKGDNISTAELKDFKDLVQKKIELQKEQTDEIIASMRKEHEEKMAFVQEESNATTKTTQDNVAAYYKMFYGLEGAKKEAAALATALSEATSEYSTLYALKEAGEASEFDLENMEKYKNQIYEIAAEMQNLGFLEEGFADDLVKQAETLGPLNYELERLVLQYKELQNKDIISQDEINDMEAMKERIAELRKEIEKLTGQKLHIDILDNNNFGKIDKSIKNVNMSITSMGKKLVKAGLAIFGIQSAYMGVRQVLNGVLSQNEGLKTTLDNIQKSLYAAFTPIVEKIINLILKLMGYINAIWNKIFGHNLFKDVESSTKNTSKNLSSGAKSAKELRKQLAGFDEANVLSNQSSSSGGAGGIAGGSGSTGGLKIPNVKLPDWLDKFIGWCKKNPKLAGILFGTIAFTLFGLGKLGGALSTVTLAKILGKSGTGAAATGASGLLGILGTLLLLSATVFFIYLDYKAITEAIEEYKKLKNAREEANADSIEESNNNIRQAQSILERRKANQLDTEQLKDWSRVAKDIIKTNSEQLKQSHLSKEAKEKLREENYKLIDTYSQLYRQGLLTKEEEYDYYKFMKEVFPDGIVAANTELKNTKKDFDALNKKFSTQYTIEMQAKGEAAITKAVNNVKDAFNKLGLKISEAFKKGEVAGLNVTSLAKSIFHAEGGIVNMPGRGVPLHYAGEAGREGIVPMDNQQQMALLGQEIAKYVTINNYVTNNVDSRKLNTILKQSENKERLANNW